MYHFLGFFSQHLLPEQLKRQESSEERSEDAREENSTKWRARETDYVATQEDVCVYDSVDPLCSHDDSCHVLILHVKVSGTPGNTV